MPKIVAINAVLVRLSIGTFSNSRQDKEITDEVRVNKKLGLGSGKWVKYKLPKECLQPITQFAGEVRRWHYDHTSPWEDGTRLLTIKGMEKYKERLKSQAVEFFKLVDAFGEQWENWLAEARLMHGPTFDMADYPANWMDMRGQFKMEAEFDPVPKPEAFALRGIAESELQAMQTELESRVQSRVQAATVDAWNRLLTPVQHMADVLANNDGRIFETMLSNIISIAEIIPTLNVENDEAMARAARDILSAVQRVNIEQLRQNHGTRTEVATVARDLIAQFGQIGQRKFATAA